MRNIRILLWSLVGLVAVGATVAFFFVRLPEPAAAGAYGRGDYTLVASDGTAVTEASFTGRPSMVFFGYTHCPDVCPTTLAEMAGWLEQLGPDGDQLQAFFITVDPERDTPEIVGDYAGAVSDRVVAVSGTRPEIDKALGAWRVYSKKVEGEDGDYLMDHTASVFLLNAEGDVEGTVTFGESSDVALEKLRRLVA